MPANGPSWGDNAIYVSGVNLTYSARAVCVVNGTTKRRAGYINSTMIVCVMPPHCSGIVEVEMEFNGLYTTSNRLKYTYDEDIEIMKSNVTFVPLEGGVGIKTNWTKLQEHRYD